MLNPTEESTEARRHSRLGLFVLVASGVIVAVMFLLGGRKLFQPTFTFETYFDESVAGLELGAPVRFRGVPLGQVSGILTSAATYERDVPLAKRREYIVVRADVNVSAEQASQFKRDAASMIQRGLRAQTQLAGLTGQQYLAIDFVDPATHPPLEFAWTPEYTYVPSAASSTQEIIANTQAFVASLNQADVETLARNLNSLVVDLDRVVNELPVKELSASARATLEKANAAIGRFDAVLADARIQHTLRNIDSVSTRIDTMLADDGGADRTVKHIDEAAARLAAMLGDNQYDVRELVKDLRVTADNLRTVSETVKRYPAGALIAGPPDKVPLPKPEASP